MMPVIHAFMEVEPYVGLGPPGNVATGSQTDIAATREDQFSSPRPIKRFESVIQHKTVMNALNQQRSDKDLCDLTLNVGNKQIYAHRMILSVACPYFKTMLNSSFRESKQKEIVMNEVDEDALQQIISFIYTASIDISHTNAESVLKVAHLLQIDEVKGWCCEVLQSEVDISNCIGIANFAELYSCDELQWYANVFFIEHFLKVGRCEEFLEVPFIQLLDVLNEDTFYVDSEKEFYCILMNWVMYNVDERKKYLSLLLNYVRLPLLGIDYINDTVASDSLIKEDQACGDYIQESQRYLDSIRTRPKQNEALFAVDIHGDSSIIDNVELWPADWRRVPKIPYNFSDVVDVACVKSFVYVIGHDGAMTSYNLRTKKWTACESHSLCSVSTRLISVEGFLYAIGRSKHQPGTTFSPADFKVQRFSPRIKKWTEFATMWGAKPRIRFCLASLNGRIYIIGGTTGSGRSMSLIDCFDPSTKEWTSQDTFIQASPVDTVAVSFDNKIYLAGGTDLCRAEEEEGCVFAFRNDDEDPEECDTSCVRCYDPDTTKWAYCGRLSSARAKLSLVVLNSKLYALGGVSNGRSYQSIEVYDKDTNTWSLCQDILLPFFNLYGNAKCVAVPLPRNYDKLNIMLRRNVTITSRVDVSRLRKIPSSAACDGSDILNASDFTDSM